MINLVDRRRLLATVGAAGLASCAGVRHGSAFWATVSGTRPEGGTQATRTYADALPYASMLLWIDGQSRDLVVLGTVEPDHRLTWFTAQKQAITTYGPFIVATVGTEVELRRTEFGPGWDTDLRRLVGRKLERTITVAHRGEASARWRSSFHLGGMETIKILGVAQQLQRVDETVVADGRAHFTNSYWIDGSGACFKSRQEVLPTVQPVNIEIVKYPAQA